MAQNQTVAKEPTPTSSSEPTPTSSSNPNTELIKNSPMTQNSKKPKRRRKNQALTFHSYLSNLVSEPDIGWTKEARDSVSSMIHHFIICIVKHANELAHENGKKTLLPRHIWTELDLRFYDDPDYSNMKEFIESRIMAYLSFMKTTSTVASLQGFEGHNSTAQQQQQRHNANSVDQLTEDARHTNISDQMNIDTDTN